jgi:hypothetical protein
VLFRDSIIGALSGSPRRLGRELRRGDTSQKAIHIETLTALPRAGANNPHGLNTSLMALRMAVPSARDWA